MEKTIEIPEGYEARIEGNKVILKPKESEDERIREVIESIIRVYGKAQGEWLAGYDMDTLVAHLRDAFACLEKQKEQKPAEWSEEDKKMLDDITVFVSGYADKRVVSDWVAFLKSLRPQPKRELYEEDNVIKNVISYLNGEYGFKTHDDEDAYRRGLIRQLKSLQPHWKPSEEQMKEYRYWYKNFVESGLASPSSKAVTVLGELLEQLKKL